MISLLAERFQLAHRPPYSKSVKDCQLEIASAKAIGFVLPAPLP
ncbi:MAG: hypothetical protein ACKVP4_09030 [Hyphomicrobium sp.]